MNRLYLVIIHLFITNVSLKHNLNTYVSLFPTPIAVIQTGKHKYNTSNLVVLQDQINNNNNNNDGDNETTATTNK